MESGQSFKSLLMTVIIIIIIAKFVSIYSVFNMVLSSLCS